MTTHGNSDTTGPSTVPRPLLRHWAQQAGVLSALPDAPVVADPPRRGTETLARILPVALGLIQGAQSTR